MMVEIQKPLPGITEATKPYWEAAKQHELVLLKCVDCGHHRHPLAPGESFMCPNCASVKQPQWVKASGKGRLITWTVVHKVFLPAFANEVPYVVAIAQLEEGPRMLANLRGVKPDEIKSDMEVEVFYEDLTDEVTLPQFRKAE